MFALLLAQGIIPGGIVGIAIWIIIVAAVVAIVYVACRAMGVEIPGWVVHVFWIVIIAIVCVAAIKFLVGAL